jgi:hypothetical protein
MEELEKNSSNIVIAILKNDFSKELSVPATNDLTDAVREKIGKLSDEDEEQVKENLENELLKLYQDNDEKDFVVKENIIYYLGRSNKVNYELLKDLYYKEENHHLQLNLFFSIIPSFDEEVEFDFISKIKPGNEYDKLIRSWTMAFFANAENPYDYVDTGIDDVSQAVAARIKRFLILKDKTNKKYFKALSYLLIDLKVIELFISNRGSTALTLNDYEVVKSIPEEFKKFSEKKKTVIEEQKQKILNFQTK